MDQINQQKYKFSCDQCGQDIEMSPPDHIHIICMVKPCIVCKYGIADNQVKRMIECDSCDMINIRYWHSTTEHSVFDYSNARYKHEQAFFDSFLCKKD